MLGKIWICLLAILLSSSAPAWAGFSLGMTKAVKAKAAELDQKVREARGTPTPTPVIHEGDLVVQGSEVLEIKDCTYIQRGNILIREQGALRITRCTFIHQAASAYHYDLNCQDAGRLEVSESRVEANGQYLWWRCLGQGTAVFQRTQFAAGFIRLWALGQAAITATDCASPEAYATEDGTASITGGSGAKLHPKKTPSNTISVAASDWEATPVKLQYPVNTPAPQDAIEISADGSQLYFLITTDLLSVLGAEMLNPPNGTYVARRSGGPEQFSSLQYYNLRQGAISNLALDGECSFTADGSKVYFHSNRPDNLGYQLLGMSANDFQDIYVAQLANGVPGPGVNLGANVNSTSPDGEQAVTADGLMLYFSSTRPGGWGSTDIYISQWNGSAWSAAVNAGNTINSAAEDFQPCLTQDGKTMYFTTERSFIRGIYRSTLSGSAWSTPELVVQGIGVGEPSLTADGQFLYFVYTYLDGASQVYDADVYYVKRK